MFVFDFETTNYSYGSALDARNRILMVSWSNGSNCKVNTFVGDIMQATPFWTDISTAPVLCAFNAKFEQHWLKRCGFDIDSKQWHDPMLAEKVLLGNRQLPVNLGATAERYGFDAKDAVIDSMMKAGVCPSEMPQKRLLARCVRDVRTTLSILLGQLDRLRQRDALHVYRNRCEFMTVLTHIEANGMDLDAKRVGEEYARYAAKVAKLGDKLREITGGINMRSPEQVAEFLYRKLKFPEKRGASGKIIRGKPSKKFPKGRPKTDKTTMLWLVGEAKTDKQKQFIGLRMDFSKANAALTKNLEFFKGVCDEYDGHFHAQFNQTVAATHRLTSSGLPLQFKQFDKPKSVQFQNMPREFKKCFTAPKGYVIAEVDSMQLEFRVAAFLGQDKQALIDIADPDFDAHILSASKINDLDYAHLLQTYRNGGGLAKILRQQAKPHTFKPLYGGTKGTPGEERYYKYFAERYAGIGAAQENWLAEVLREDCLTLPWGMTFYWQTYVNKRGVAMNSATHKPVAPQVANYPVQNLATAEIVPIAIVALYKRCKEEKINVKFVNTVHDSVIVYVRDKRKHVQAFREAAEWAFTTAVYEHLRDFYGMEFTVPLGMEMIIGSHWGEGTETKHDDVDNRRKEV